MEDVQRQEYPGMLAHLHPTQAVQVFQERVRRIAKLNVDIADWLQERRKIEEQYVAGMRKLMGFKVPNEASDLGIFQPTWDGILRSVESIANSHRVYCQRVEQDVELPLRAFQQKEDMTSMATISGNLQGMAKELEEAQHTSEKLGKKGGKTSAQKMDVAASRLDQATQQWESQAPFIFESLQALDEKRVGHLRDALTQLETHEVDQATRNQATAEAMLNMILEIKGEDEIKSLVERVTQNRPRLERRANTRQSSIAGNSVSGRPQSSHAISQAQQSSPVPQVPQIPPHHHGHGHGSFSRDDDVVSERSNSRQETRHETPHTESKLRSRIGTMLGRRRQSVHGFGQLSPSKGTSSGPFNRGSGSGSSHGRSVSPRGSSYNLNETLNNNNTNNRLSSLAETPDSPVPPRTADANRAKAVSRSGPTNGIHGGDSSFSAAGNNTTTNNASLNGTGASHDVFGVGPPPGPPPSRSQRAFEKSVDRSVDHSVAEPKRDAEGFSLPPKMDDPISVAQRQATASSSALGSGSGDDGGEPAFKVDIKKEPVAEEDAAAKEEALSNVANTLSMAMPSRKTGTIRGRRDVRNTIYVPSPTVQEGSSFNNIALPRTPTFSSTASKPTAVSALASETSGAGASDTQSVRSATSLGSLAHFRHPDMSQPGLNTSIIESVSANFEGGELKSAKLAGEIAFSYNTSATSPGRETETIRINNFPLLEAIGPNRIFVQNTAAADEFTLNTSHLQQRANIAFTFRAHSENPASLAAHCPLVLRPVWKTTADKQLGLLLQYRLNPLSRLPSPVTLHNLVFIASYQGARASGVKTKPPGTHLKDKHLVYWRLGDVTLTEEWSKIVCRIVGEQGAEPQPGQIETRWEYTANASASASEHATSGTGITISQLQPSDSKGKGAAAAEEDPFADESVLPSPHAAGNWTDVPLTRQIVSGRYEAK